MIRKFRRRLIIIVFTVLVLWIFFAQTGMSYRVSDERAKKEFSNAGIELKTVTFNAGNYQMHYAETGSDTLPTLFFVHGSPGSWIKFGIYLKDTGLVKKFRMISIDRPGFGFSEYRNTRNLDDQSKIVSLLLKKINNGKPIYAIGRSYGGPIIVRLAVDNPAMFSGLYLLASSIDPDAERPEKWRRYLIDPPLNFLVPGAWRQSNEEIWYLKKDLVTLAPGFAGITCPVFIFHSENDEAVPVSNVDYAKKMLINAQKISVQIVNGKAHNISDTQFDLIKKSLLQLY